MPFINIKLTKEDGGASVEQKEKLIKGMTDLVSKVMGRGEKTTLVVMKKLLFITEANQRLKSWL